MKRLIIAPHVDDELYGCIGLILSDPLIDIMHCTYSTEQNHRRKVLKNILPNNLLHLSSSWEDSSNNKPQDRIITTELDYIMTQYDEVYFNSSSIHQDHEFINKAVLRSLRRRPNLRVSRAYEYDYHYNMLTNDYNGCLINYYDNNILLEIRKVWKMFDDECKVSKSSTSYIHYNNWIKYGEYLGSLRDKSYAEVFRPIILDNIIGE